MGDVFALLFSAAAIGIVYLLLMANERRHLRIARELDRRRVPSSRGEG